MQRRPIDETKQGRVAQNDKGIHAHTYAQPKSRTTEWSVPHKNLSDEKPDASEVSWSSDKASAVQKTKRETKQLRLNEKAKQVTYYRAFRLAESLEETQSERAS